MARQRQQILSPITLPEDVIGKKPTVKNVHMHAGLDLVGASTSFNNKTTDIYERQNSILLVSKKTNRQIVIPYANVKGYELI